MKKLILTTGAILFLAGLAAGAGKETGDIRSVNPGNKEIIVNVKSGADLKMGELLEIKSDTGRILLEVTFPMQTVAKCKINGKGRLSDLKKGMTVYRYNKEDEQPGKPLETKLIGNMEMVLLKGGKFKMGSDKSDEEKPVHTVTVDGFWIGKFEVTQKEYAEITGTNPSRFKGDYLPVESVSWKEAVEFCKKFSEKYGVKARLPYEAEWEYACRGGTVTKYYWGESTEFSVIDQYAVFGENSYNNLTETSKNYGTHKVGSKKPNLFGLYDMNGNVMEWCSDYYSVSYYKSSPAKNPTGPSTGNNRVLRGGAWYYNSYWLRSSFRYSSKPEFRAAYDGFRIVVSR